jgi:nucleotide-binding universal stress UspA family protein
MKVLVPTDFSATAASGLHYAISFVANYGSGHIHVLHTVEKEADLAAAQTQLDTFCAIDAPAGITITHNITVGDYNEAIGQEAEAQQCALIIMATKGAHGILNLFGANFDQNLLENSAHIPILTVDARNHEHVNDIFMTTR